MLVRCPHTRRNIRRAAFTLMEVLVVVAIIVVLAGIATVSFKYLSGAKEDATRAKIKKVETAVVSYNLRNKQFPTDLVSLTQVQPDNSQAYLEPGDILDEWGQPIELDLSQMSPTGKPKIWSRGEPGTGRAISNW